jgi:hypothetical protein
MRATPPSSPGWGPSPLPDPEEPAGDTKPADGVTKTGLPFAQRGRVALDFAGCRNTDGDPCGVSMNLVAAVPIVDKVLFDGIVPLGIGGPNSEAVMGNPTLGARGLVRHGDNHWIAISGSFGVPIVGDDDFFIAAVPRGYWNLRHQLEDYLPLNVGVGYEGHFGLLALRVHAEPSLWAPLGNNDDTHGAFDHSLELQVGHGIGGGLRYQGVVLGPNTDDPYHAALQPFLVVSRELGFVRTGIQFPLNEPLGPAFENSWGFHFAAGVHVD